MMIAAVITVFIILSLFDLPQLIQAKRRRDLVVYSAVFFLSFLYTLLFFLRVQIPSPIEQLQLFYDQALGLNYDRWR